MSIDQSWNDGRLPRVYHPRTGPCESTNFNVRSGEQETPVPDSEARNDRTRLVYGVGARIYNDQLGRLRGLRGQA